MKVYKSAFLQGSTCSRIWRGEPLSERDCSQRLIQPAATQDFFLFRKDLFFLFTLISLFPSYLLKSLTGHYGGLACIHQDTVSFFLSFLLSSFQFLFQTQREREREPKDKQSVSRPLQINRPHIDNTTLLKTIPLCVDTQKKIKFPPFPFANSTHILDEFIFALNIKVIGNTKQPTEGLFEY